MRFLLAFLLTAVIAYLIGLYLPWWSVALAAFAMALLIPQGIGRSFLTGFLGIFALWFVVGLWIDIQNNHVLSSRIAPLLSLGSSSLLLLLICALLGGLVGGFAAMTGSSIRKKAGSHPM